MMSEHFKGEQGDTLTVSEWIVHPVDGSQPILTEWELHRTPETGFEHHTRRRAQTVATVSGRLVLGRGLPSSGYKQPEPTTRDCDKPNHLLVSGTPETVAERAQAQLRELHRSPGMLGTTGGELTAQSSSPL
jgi:hypothetical protein